MATPAMNESWRRVKDQILTIWSDADFGDTELKKARGNLMKMVELIHDKTGEPRGEIMQKLAAFL